MVSGMMSTIFSYIWLVAIVFSPFSLLFCRKKKDDQAGKERTISGDSVKAVPQPISHSKIITSPAKQTFNSYRRRRIAVKSNMVTGNGQRVESCRDGKPINVELHKQEVPPQRCSNTNHQRSLLVNQNSAGQVKQADSLKKNNYNEEQCRSRRRRQYKDNKKNGLKQNFVRNVLRKVDAKPISKEGNYDGKDITEATQDESLNSSNTSNTKKARRAKRLSRIPPITNNIAKNRLTSKQSRIMCVSTQSDASVEMSQDLQQKDINDGGGGGGKEDEEFNNDLDTMAGVRSIEREETPSPQ